MERAVEAYHNQDKDDTKRGYQKVCKEIMERCWQEDTVKVYLDKQTLLLLIEGEQSKAKLNVAKGLLSEDEENIILKGLESLLMKGI